MSLTQGVDFRQTAGFVTDPTNFTVELGNAFNPTYPAVLSPSGVNGGWEDAVSGTRDRTAFTGASASLSGIHFIQSGSARYRIDLPAAGTYNVQAAFGDNASGQGPFTATFQDTTTVLSTPVNNGSTSGADEFYDATGVQRTSHTDWVANNAAKSLTFSTAIFRTVITFSGNGPIATLFIQSAGSSGVNWTGAETLGAFVISGAFGNLDRWEGAETLDSFVSAAAFANLDHWTAAETLAAFISSGTFHNTAAAALVNDWLVHARRIGRR